MRRSRSYRGRTGLELFETQLKSIAARGLCASVAIRTGLRAKSRLHAVRADRFSGGGGICLSFLFLTSNLGHSRLGDAAFQPQDRAE